MANVTSGSPIKMDTATGSWAANLLPNSMPLDVRMLYWESPSVATDTVQITDQDGLILWEATAEAAVATPGNSQIFYFQPRSLVLTKPQGWKLNQISSGKLWIFFVYA